MRARVDRLKLAAAAAGLVGCLTGAAPALGAGYTLAVTGPSSAAVGQPVVFQATGSNPPTDFFTSWLDVDALPASTVGSCPAGYMNAFQLANTTGGEQIANGQREEVDPAGNWALSFGWTPSTAGRWLICAYTNDGATGTLAMASRVLDVQSAGSPAPGGGGSSPAPAPRPSAPSPSGAPARPANTTRPRVVRSGRSLVCRRGTWAGSPTRFAYRWTVNGKARRGTTGQTLRVTRALRGRRVGCRVTATNAAGSATAVSRPLRVG